MLHKGRTDKFPVGTEEEEHWSLCLSVCTYSTVQYSILVRVHRRSLIVRSADIAVNPLECESMVGIPKYSVVPVDLQKIYSIVRVSLQCQYCTKVCTKYVLN